MADQDVRLIGVKPTPALNDTLLAISTDENKVVRLQTADFALSADLAALQTTVAELESTPAPTAAATSFVERVGTSFHLAGAPWRVVGVNLSNAANGVADCGPVWTAAERREQFRRIAQEANCSVVRVSFYQGYAPTTGGTTNFTGLDACVALAKEYGLKLMVTFEDHWGHCFGDTVKADTWYTNGFKTTPYNGYALTYKDFVSRVVTRYKDNPVIFAWSLMNEATPRNTSNVYQLPALLSFSTEMAAYVKSIDPNHLLTVGVGGTDEPDTAEVWRQVHAISNVDFADVHWYAQPAVAWPGTQPYTQTQTSLAARVWQTHQLGKPCVIGEVGDDTTDTPLVRAANMNARINAAFDNNVAAVMLWAWEPLNYGEHSFNVGDPLVGVLAAHSAVLKGGIIAVDAPQLLPQRARLGTSAFVRARADQTVGTAYTPGVWTRFGDVWRSNHEGEMRPWLFMDGFRADGVTNVTAGYQRAIEEASQWAMAGLKLQTNTGTFQAGNNAPGSGVVMVAPGVSLCDNLKLRHRVTLKGHGAGYVFRRNQQTGWFIETQFDANMHSKYNTLRDFSIDGNWNGLFPTGWNLNTDGTPYNPSGNGTKQSLCARDACIVLRGDGNNDYNNALDEDYDAAHRVIDVYIFRAPGDAVRCEGAGGNFVRGLKTRTVRGHGLWVWQDNNILQIDVGRSGMAGVVAAGDGSRYGDSKAWYSGRESGQQVTNWLFIADTGEASALESQDATGPGYLFDGAHGWTCSALQADSNDAIGAAWPGVDINNSTNNTIEFVARNRYNGTQNVGQQETALRIRNSSGNDVTVKAAGGFWGTTIPISADSVIDGNGVIIPLRATAVRSFGGNSTLDWLDYTTILTAAATVTLPTAIGKRGWEYRIKRTGTTGAYSVVTTASQTIDGQASLTIVNQYDAYTLVSDGANWVSV